MVANKLLQVRVGLKLIFVLLSAGWVWGSEELNHQSIHQTQVEHGRRFSAKKEKGSSTQGRWYRPISRPLYRLNSEVFGFDPWWVDDTYLRYDLLTTIACFGVEVRGDGEIENLYGFPSRWSGVIDYAHRVGVRVVLTAFCFDGYTIHDILTESKDSAIRNLLFLIESANIEGVNIDFEGVFSEDRENLVRFMEDLTDTFHKEIPGSYITLCTPPVDWQDAFDYKSLGDGVDGLFIMGYDYHWRGSDIAGPVAPLRGWGRYNVTWTVDTYLSEVNPEKLILGCPYYGYDWPTESDTVRSKTEGRGEAKTYSQTKVESQIYLRRWDEESETPWYTYGSFQQCWYDDEESLNEKYKLAIEKDLGGIGIWALGYDKGRPELWTTLREMVVPPEEVFSNGGFEEWVIDTLALPIDTTPVPYGFWFGKHTRGLLDSLFVKEGRYALRQIPDSLGDSFPVVSGIYQDVKVKPERLYQFSGWTRVEGDFENKASLTIKWFSSTYRLLREDSSEVLSNGDDFYHLLSTGIVESPEGVWFARLSCEVLAYGGSVLWDDLSFSEMRGVEEAIVSSDRVHISPSPTGRSIEIRYATGYVSLKLYNCSGVFMGESSNSRIDLSHLPNGIYFCLVSFNNHPIAVKKLVLLR